MLKGREIPSDPPEGERPICPRCLSLDIPSYPRHGQPLRRVNRKIRKTLATRGTFPFPLGSLHSIIYRHTPRRSDISLMQLFPLNNALV